MDELQIKGKKYISSKRASEISGYAKDYVGQLARQGKVPATRVGRAWYVDELAIVNHSKGNSEEELTPDSLLSIPISKKVSLHSLRTNTNPSFNTWGQIKYINDDYDLLPKPINTEEAIDVNEIKITKISEIMPRKEVSHRMDGIRSRAIESKKEVITAIKKDNIKENSKPTVTLLLTAGSLIVFVTLFTLGGIYMPSMWAFDTSSFNYLTASATNAQLDLLSVFFFAIFDEGIKLIGGFLSLLFQSLAIFFNLGLEFIQNIVLKFLG